jgi:hypothetical protein
LYQKDGLPVVATGKEPRFSEFGARALRAGEASVRVDWAEHPDSGIGVLLGVRPRCERRADPDGAWPAVMDLEIDDPEAARPVLARVFPGGVPGTLRFESNGPGRWHYLFAIDDEVAGRLWSMGIHKQVINGLHLASDGMPSGDPAYAGLELRFGSLCPHHPGVTSLTQTVVPPTLRADGTPRTWVGDRILPFPSELLADLERNSAAARAQAEALACRDQPREPLDRDELRGLDPIDKIKAQFRALDLRMTPKGDGSGYYASCTSPEHPDQRPSMTITVLDRDQVYFRPGGSPKYCKAGTVLINCNSRHCDIKDILDGIGLWVRDLEPDRYARSSSKARGNGHRFTELVAPSQPGAIDPARQEEFEKILNECFLALVARPGLQRALAESWGVSEATLAALGVGWKEDNPHWDGETGQWDDYGPAWVFPMVNDQGQIVNLQRRFQDEDLGKRGMRGGRLGLFLPAGWRGRRGPIYCVEGASDTAALWDLGLLAIGRPANTSGDWYLGRLLQADERELIVVGENDLKGDGAWPGDPRPFAAKLARRLGRPIKVIVPPAPFKDARAWCQSVDSSIVRIELLRRTLEAESVVPSAATTHEAAAPGRPSRRSFSATLPLRIRNNPHGGA